MEGPAQELGSNLSPTNAYSPINDPYANVVNESSNLGNHQSYAKLKNGVSSF